MNDGDKALVVQDETFIKVAERNMDGIVPLYYEMAKAPAEIVNSEDIYKSLIMAYKANIGEISNNITKIWNSHDINLDVIKWLCMENNFTIDFAKTLYMPSRPKEVNDIIVQYIKARVPHFFIYAKDKEKDKVEPLNDSTVNQLNSIVPKKPIQFKKIAGKLNYKKLMNNSKVELNNDIIKTFEMINKSKNNSMNRSDDLNSEDVAYFYKEAKDKLLCVINDEKLIVDILVKYLYGEKNSKRKSTLWNTFGDVLIENLQLNLQNTKQCECCGKRIEVKNNKVKYCDECAKFVKNEQNKLYYHLGK